MRNSTNLIIHEDCKWIIRSAYVNPKKSYEELVLATVLISLFSVVAVTLNLLTILIFYREKKLKCISDILLCALATTDLYARLLSMSFLMATSILLAQDQISCSVFVAATLIRMTGFTLTLSTTLLITTDRYAALFHPYSYHIRHDDTRFLAKILIAAWSVCIAISLFSLTPKLKLVRLAIVFAIAFAIPFSLSVHLRALLLARRMNRQIQDLQVRDETRERVHRELKTARSTAIVISSTLICYLPKPLMPAIKALDGSSPVLEAIMPWSTICLMLNSVLNPLIYAWQFQWFRNGLSKFVNLC